MSPRVVLLEGDITAQSVDVVVNAANAAMRGGGGVDGAIHRAGGPAILADCVRLFPDGLAVGGAGATTAGNLPARWVVHVVGPNWNAGQRDRGLLAACYRNALGVADELGAATVAFPAISAGIFGWPLDDAARTAIQVVRATPTRVVEARFVLFTTAAFGAFSQALDGGQGGGQTTGSDTGE
ncbi:O-acetyl-ADP-ribose deacetylase [Actinopolymorpha sp. NPDC004070]|uniref:O-acetyl-ADP-ribose deacetylase n=1 Tax=Actinopolymorpha sp. NPDC004070 TaxID=3154548 RepID=UPI0033ABD2F1